MFTNEKCAQVKGPQLSLRSNFLKTLLQDFCPTVQVFLSNIQRRHESKSPWQPGSTIHIKDVCTPTLQLRRTGTQTPGRRGASGEHFSCKGSWRFFPDSANAPEETPSLCRMVRIHPSDGHGTSRAMLESAIQFVSRLDQLVNYSIDGSKTSVFPHHRRDLNPRCPPRRKQGSCHPCRHNNRNCSRQRHRVSRRNPKQ
jgi:hypothetical protein